MVMTHTARHGAASSLHPVRGQLHSRGAAALVRRAQQELTAARRVRDPEVVFVQAHLAALRFAAAAVSTTVAPKRGRAGSVWTQMVQRVPDLAGWATTFEAAAQVRQRIEAGLSDGIDADSASRYLAHVDAFGLAVRDWLEGLQGVAQIPHETPWQRAS